MSEIAHLDVIVSEPPGSVLTSLVLRLSAEHGVLIQPRVTLDGARLPLRHELFGGAAEFVVSAAEGGTRIRLVGTPPPWPFSIGWPRRMQRRYLRLSPLLSAA